MLNYTSAWFTFFLNDELEIILIIESVSNSIFYSNLLIFLSQWCNRYYMDRANGPALWVDGEVVYLDTSINSFSLFGASKGQSHFLISKSILLGRRGRVSQTKCDSNQVIYASCRCVALTGGVEMRTTDWDQTPNSDHVHKLHISVTHPWQPV